MDGFMEEYLSGHGVLASDELDAEQLEAVRAYVAQFDEIARELVGRLEPDRRDALCEQVVALGLCAVHGGERLGVPVEVAEFVGMVFSRCNISFTDERRGDGV